MTVTAHIFPNFVTAMGSHSVNLSTDTLKCGLVASGTDPNTGGAAGWDAYTTVANFLTNGTYPQTEVSTSGTGYTRAALATVGWSLSGLYTTLTVSVNPSWATSTISAVRAFFYDYTAGGSSDTAGLMMCYWDFGGTDSDSAGTYTLTLPTANAVTQALLQYTAS